MEQLGTGALLPVCLSASRSTPASHLKFLPLLPLHKQGRLTLVLAVLPCSDLQRLQHEDFLVVKDKLQSVL